jgi:lipopolysaccharide export system permease protein
MFTRLDRYLLRKFVVTFVFMVGLMVVVITVIDVAERFDDFWKNDVALDTAIARYYLNLIPWLANLLSPICVFLAAIFFTARLTQDTEFIAMLSGGISFYRLLRPYLIASLLFAGLSFWLNNYQVPASIGRRVAFEFEYFDKTNPGLVLHMHKKVSADVYVYIQRYEGRTFQANVFSIERFDSAGRLVSKLTAPSAMWVDSTSSWHLNNPIVRDFLPNGEEQLRTYTSLDTTLRLSHEDVFQIKSFAEAMPLPQLLEYIELERERGSDTINDLKLELYMRMAAPFASFVLTIIAFALSTRKRRGGIALQLGLGFMIAFLYVFFLSVSRSALGESIAPGLAVWLPNIVFMVIGLVLLRLVPK